jgi:fructose-1,6-bisphosphatase
MLVPAKLHHDTRSWAKTDHVANTNMRWIAAAVGDLHCILMQGGVFWYCRYAAGQ